MTPAVVLLTFLVILSFGSYGYSQLLDSNCIASHRMRIIGGQDAQRTPWMAYLIRDNTFACGGSLIAHRFVLTAAHCTKVNDNLFVRLGEYDSSRTTDGQTRHYRVVSIYRHENYIDFRNHDIAVLKLSRKVVYDAFIRPICIFFNSGYQSFANSIQDFILTGWGQMAHNKMPTTLQKMSLRRVSNEYCGVPGLSICCWNPLQYACFGDSGSPLMSVVKYGQSTIYVQFGVTSSVTGNCDGFSSYLDLTSYIPWLSQTLSRNWA
ncbi:testisin isoform X2 [Drosophila sechellia]|uniref:GM20059 n=1 Tax=Drosophila sechellia TaxID=7238 RepID=B4HSX3_DROSE|nr:testisin isoform X2 [Drosophila sechellia]EDW48137.1 GM20059 [Drosophila sechellia]